jgi:hypothetical protein
MFPVAILSFLTGAVLAWGFRVWILVPATVLVTVSTTIFGVWLGSGLLSAIGHGLLVGLAPQFGYAFGLFARSTLLSSRSPFASRSSRDSSVAMLYKQSSSNRSRSAH